MFLKDKIKKILLNKINKRRINEAMKCYKEFDKVLDLNNQELISFKTICIVLPFLEKFSGGMTTILHLGTELEKKGISVNYISCVKQPINSMRDICDINLPGYLGNIVDYNDSYNKKYDVILATSFETCYFANKMNGYKAYFLQDFEPLFFKAGDRYFCSMLTYELGYHLISFGPWILNKVDQFFPQNQFKKNFIDFPYSNVYLNRELRDYYLYKEKREFVMVVYSRSTTPRRMPGLIQYIVPELKERFEKVGYKLIVKYFGDDSKYNNGINLGKLNSNQLVELYKNSDFGMVFSYTNISLVPYEMIAAGLPLIELKSGSFSDFFGIDSAFLFDKSIDSLFEQIYEYINNPKLLEKQHQENMMYLSKLSWEKSAQQFIDIIKNEAN